MSDSEDSTITYTEVSSPFEDLSDIGSPGVDGLPMMLEDPYVEATLQALPSPDYVSGPEYSPSPIYVPYVPKPVYPEFMPLKNDVLPAEEQPLPAAILPTADSPGYITESNPEEDPDEDDKDPEEDPANYPDDKDDDDDKEEESSGDDANNDEEEEDEEEEHLAPAASILPPACRTTTRMSIRAQTPISFPPAAEVDRFLAISTPPPSSLTSYSSPLPHIPSPPLPVSSLLPVSPLPLPASPSYPLGYKAVMIWLRAESPSTSHLLPLPSPIVLPHTRIPPLLLIPLPTPSLPLLLPYTICKASVFEITLPPQKRLCIALGLRFEFGESSSASTPRPTRGFRADYGFVSTLDDEIRQDPEREVGYYEIYGRLDDAQDDRSLMSGQLNMLRRDRHAHARTTGLMESEARLSREAWVQSMDASDTARSETQVTVLQSPARPEVPEEDGSSS
ncbi:hypothetical protein Tco_0603718 [Tanacetum coccineum]